MTPRDPEDIYFEENFGRSAESEEALLGFRANPGSLSPDDVKRLVDEILFLRHLLENAVMLVDGGHLDLGGIRSSPVFRLIRHMAEARRSTEQS